MHAITQSCRQGARVGPGRGCRLCWRSSPGSSGCDPRSAGCWPRSTTGAAGAVPGHRLRAALRAGRWPRSLRWEPGALPDAVGHQRLGRPPGWSARGHPGHRGDPGRPRGPAGGELQAGQARRRAGATPRPARLPSMLAVTAGTGEQQPQPVAVITTPSCGAAGRRTPASRWTASARCRPAQTRSRTRGRSAVAAVAACDAGSGSRERGAPPPCSGLSRSEPRGRGRGSRGRAPAAERRSARSGSECPPSPRRGRLPCLRPSRNAVVPAIPRHVQNKISRTRRRRSEG
jgi:hypothetical protein